MRASKIAVVGFAVLASTAGFGALTGADAALVTAPAPPSTGSAVAVKVGDVASIGSTGAAAGQSGSGASAVPVSVGGVPILGGTSGTASSGQGSLIDTGANKVVQVAVAPWQTEVKQNEAASSTALATVKLEGIGDLAVTPSSSFAWWTPGQSHSAAVSDGAVVHLGDQTIKILHAESNSDGFGKTYLVQLFGQNIGVTDANGCMLDIGALANVGCLKALSGAANSSVAQALISKSPLAKVVAAAASGGSAKVVPSNVAGASIDNAASRGLLARTGANALQLFALGLLLAVGGATAVKATRKQQVAMVPAKLR